MVDHIFDKSDKLILAAYIGVLVPVAIAVHFAISPFLCVKNFFGH